MKRAKRTFTQEEKDLVFDLWKQGIGFSDIGKVKLQLQVLFLLHSVNLGASSQDHEPETVLISH